MIDIKELDCYAKEKEKDRLKMTKFAQARRHERRKDFSLSDNEWIDSVEYFDNKCAYCGKDKKLTYDHFIAFSKGGSFTKENIIPCCKNCNSSKRDNDFEEWYKKQNFYSEELYNKILKYINLMKEEV